MNKYKITICPVSTKKKFWAIHQKNVFSEGDEKLVLPVKGYNDVEAIKASLKKTGGTAVVVDTQGRVRYQLTPIGDEMIVLEYIDRLDGKTELCTWVETEKEKFDDTFWELNQCKECTHVVHEKDAMKCAKENNNYCKNVRYQSFCQYYHSKRKQTDTN